MTKRNSNIPNRPDGRPRNGASRPRPARHPLSRAIAGALLPASLVLGPVPVLAGPEGEQVIAGQVDVSRPDARTTVIDQTSHRAIVGWNRFDLAKDELAKFNQPSASSVILNRIGGQDPSRIFGTIDANGQVFLVNPRGIFFSPTARISAASFLASTLDIADEDFMAGNYTFAAPDGVDPGAIINYGLMEAATGGSVTLMGGAVRNEGIIIANQGYVTLAAGRKATLDFDGDGLLRFAVEGDVTAVPVTNGMENEEGETVEESTDAVHNKGTIQADGGQVLLTGRAAREVFTNVVNNEGLIRARRIENAGGVIRLAGGDGVTRNSGALDATGENGAGGRVEVSGEKITLADGATLDASGPAGGGTIRVGGGIRGEKLAADIPNALETEVAEDVTIMVDATETGDGGTAVVWADEKVTVEGELSARGGPEGGDGGYVEVSAKDMWRFANWAANVDVGALAGRAGTFLLDPDNITILPGASGGSGPNNTLYAEDISDFLGTTGNGSGASMDVSTLSGSGSDEGNIVFDVGSGPINITWNDDSSHLIFTASNDLDMGSGAYGTNSITIDGAGNFTGDFGQDNNGGALTLKNVTITSTSTSFTGGAGDDTFTIEAALTGNLTGGDGADTFHVGKALTGNVLGGSGADVVAFIAADGQIAGALDFGTDGGKLDYSALAAAQPVTLETFTATSNGTGFDVAAGGASSITGAVSNLTELAGSTNTDTLTGVSAAGTFTMDGATGIYTSIDSGGAGGTYTLTITDIENLVGGSGDDVFIIDNAYAGNLTGGTGNDTFTINAKLTGSIAGGADTDTLTGLSTTNTFIVTTNGTGTVAEAVTNGFTGVENLTGGAGDDRFTIKASHTGDLTGAGGDDAFAINAQLDGSVAGGAGTDTLTGLSTTNTFVVTANGTGTAAEAITGSFTDIENLIGGAGDDSFTIGAYYEGTLTGGTGNNRFDIGAQLAGNIIGEGEDTVNFTAGGGVVNAISFSGSSGKLDYSSLGAQMVTLTDTAGIGFKATTSFALGGITGLTELVGSASGVDTLAGLATGGAFTINGGVTDASTGSYVSTNTLTITDMDNLTGGAGADIFTIDSAHTGTLTGEGGDDTFDIRKLLTGNIAGGAGEDTVTLLTGGSVAGNVGFGVDGGTLDYSALGAATVALTALGSSKGFDATLSSSAHVTGNVTDMTGLLGSASGMDTLVGLAATGGTFTIDDNVGSSYVSGAGTLSIANMENLTGGSQIDAFAINSDHAGQLTGGGGTDTFDFDATLTGDIMGGAGDDTVTLLASGHIAGAVYFGVEGGTLDYGALAASEVTLTGFGSDAGFNASLSSQQHVTDGLYNVTGLTGSADHTDTLRGLSSIAGTFTINATTANGSSGTYESDNAGTTHTLAIVDMNNLTGSSVGDDFIIDVAHTGTLTGGAGNDAFIIGATLTGEIQGGAGLDTLEGNSIDAVTLTGANADGFAGEETDIVDDFDGINEIIGNGGTLTGLDEANTWDLDADSTYSYTYTDGNGVDTVYTLPFSGFDNLQGKSYVDIFNVTADVAAPSAYNLAGEGGNDVFNIGGAQTGNIAGGADNDIVILTASGWGMPTAENSVTGVETLQGRDENSTWTLNADGTTSEYAATGDAGTLDFRTVFDGALVTLQAGTAGDTFTVNAASDYAIYADAGSDTLQGSVINKVLLTTNLINGEAVTSADDKGFIGTEPDIGGGFHGINVLIGNGGTLTGMDVASTWDLDTTENKDMATYTDTVSTDTADGHVLEFEGFAELWGKGRPVDRFNVYSASDLSVNDHGGASVVAFMMPVYLTDLVDFGPDGGTLDYSALADYTGSTTSESVILAATTATANGTGFDINAGNAPFINQAVMNITGLIGPSGETDELVGLTSGGEFTIHGDPSIDNNETGEFTGYYASEGKRMDIREVNNLTGLTKVDTFNIKAPHIGNLTANGNLTGNAVVDIVRFADDGTLIGDIIFEADGGTGGGILDFTDSNITAKVVLAQRAVNSIGFDATAPSHVRKDPITGEDGVITDMVVVVGSGKVGDQLTGLNEKSLWILEDNGLENWDLASWPLQNPAKTPADVDSDNIDFVYRTDITDQRDLPFDRFEVLQGGSGNDYFYARGDADSKGGPYTLLGGFSDREQNELVHDGGAPITAWSVTTKLYGDTLFETTRSGHLYAVDFYSTYNKQNVLDKFNDPKFPGFGRVREVYGEDIFDTSPIGQTLVALGAAFHRPVAPFDTRAERYGGRLVEQVAGGMRFPSEEDEASEKPE